MRGVGGSGEDGAPRACCLSFHAPYRCANSGACCTSGWRIPVGAGLRQQLDEALDGGRLALPTGGPALFVADADLPADAAGILELASDGSCACYERDRRRCAIHHQLGEACLPASCRHFPRVALIDCGRASITLSHYCPTAARLLFAAGPAAAIVEAPPGFSPSALEGLDARPALPPLLHPRMLADRRAYRSWERFVVGALARGSGAEDALLRVIDVTEDVRRWRPGQVTLEDALDESAAREWARPAASSPPRLGSAGLALDALVRDAAPASLRPRRSAAAVEVFDRLVAPAWRRHAPVVRRYLTARAFANWCSYQGRGFRSVLCSVVAALALLRVEAAGACERAGRPIDADLLCEAIRSADLLLLHLASREDLARRLSDIEETDAEGMIEAL